MGITQRICTDRPDENRNRRMKIVSIEDNTVHTIGNYCLTCNKTLKEISLNNVVSIGAFFLFHNKTLREKIKKEIQERKAGKND